MGIENLTCPEASRLYVATLLGRFDFASLQDEDEIVKRKPKPLRTVVIAAPSRELAEVCVITSRLFLYMDGAYDSIRAATKKEIGCNPDAVVDADGTVKWSRPFSDYQSEWRSIELQCRVFGRPTVDDEAIPVINPGDYEGKQCWQVSFEDRFDNHFRCIVEAPSAEKALAAFDDHPMSYPIRLNPLDSQAKRYATAINQGDPIPGMGGVVADSKLWITADGKLKPDSHVGYMEPDMIGGKHPWLKHVYRVVECGAQYRLPTGRFVSPEEFCKPVNCAVCNKNTAHDYIQRSGDHNIYCSQECIDKAHGDYVLVPSVAEAANRAYGPISGLQAAEELRSRYRKGTTKLLRLTPVAELPEGDASPTKKAVRPTWDDHD